MRLEGGVKGCETKLHDYHALGSSRVKNIFLWVMDPVPSGACFVQSRNICVTDVFL